MPKARIESDAITRMRRACLTLEQLHEETRRLCDSITAEARNARAVASDASTKAKSPRRKR
jgi:hypothetical protein